MKAIEKLKKAEIDTGVEDSAGSWHSDYRDSAYIFVGWLIARLALNCDAYEVEELL